MGIFYFKNLKELRKYLIWEETNTKKRMPRCVYLKFSSLGFISLIILDGLGLVRKKRTLATNFKWHPKKIK
jgi:hypothetical protein